jgi:hypothetical protein
MRTSLVMIALLSLATLPAQAAKPAEVHKTAFKAARKKIHAINEILVSRHSLDWSADRFESALDRLEHAMDIQEASVRTNYFPKKQRDFAYDLEANINGLYVDFQRRHEFDEKGDREARAEVQRIQPRFFGLADRLRAAQATARTLVEADWRSRVQKTVAPANFDRIEDRAHVVIQYKTKGKAKPQFSQGKYLDGGSEQVRILGRDGYDIEASTALIKQIFVLKD